MDLQEKEARQSLGGEVKLGHCLDVVLKNADVKVQQPSFTKLYEQLCAGITLNKGAMNYMFDKKTKSNWYFILARALTITWIEDCRYWKWATCNKIEAAELLNVCWLDVRGKIKESMLSPNISYEVAFVVMLTPEASGWNISPVNIELKKPNGSKIERKECLEGKPRGQWFEIVVGDLKIDNYCCGKGGEMEFGLYEHGGHWKSGMLMKGVRIGAKGCGCA